MKNLSYAGAALVGILLGVSSVTALAQPSSAATATHEVTIASPVTTGSVVALAPDKRTMTIRATPSAEPITFYGMDRANVMTGSGRQATLANVQIGLPVTVFYTPQEKHWVVSKIVIPEPVQVQPAPLPALTGAEIKALQSPAANDDDITTQPNNKARIDDDITTQPGKNALAQPDITKRPK